MLQTVSSPRPRQVPPPSAVNALLPRRKTPAMATAAKPADPILLPLDKLRPTQGAVGMRAVAAKREKIEARSRKRKKRFLAARPIPAVRGPGEAYYIVDHHHLSVALLQSDVEKAFVHVIDDMSELSFESFWRRMFRIGWLHPYDEAGRRIRPHALPARLSELGHDPYRDLAWSVRRAGGFAKSGEPYAEFHWAQFYRSHIPEEMIGGRYKAAFSLAMSLTRSDRARHLPGFIAPA